MVEAPSRERAEHVAQAYVAPQVERRPCHVRDLTCSRRDNFKRNVIAGEGQVIITKRRVPFWSPLWLTTKSIGSQHNALSANSDSQIALLTSWNNVVCDRQVVFSINLHVMIFDGPLVLQEHKPNLMVSAGLTSASEQEH